MGKAKSKEPSLELEDLGKLENYADEELLWVREKLIADVERIQGESAHHAKRIKELNQARHQLQEEAARRARALRAVKHTLSQRQRPSGEWPSRAGVEAARAPAVKSRARAR
jgi:predicted nuclease with TOPRIM domain